MRFIASPVSVSTDYVQYRKGLKIAFVQGVVVRGHIEPPPAVLVFIGRPTSQSTIMGLTEGDLVVTVLLPT